MDFLLSLILAADVGSSRDVVASIAKVSANVGVNSCRCAVLTGVVSAVVVRSSVDERTRHANIMIRAIAVVGFRLLRIRGPQM